MPRRKGLKATRRGPIPKPPSRQPPQARLPLPQKPGGRHGDDKKTSRQKERRRLRREIDDAREP